MRESEERKSSGVRVAIAKVGAWWRIELLGSELNDGASGLKLRGLFFCCTKWNDFAYNFLHISCMAARKRIWVGKGRE